MYRSTRLWIAAAITVLGLAACTKSTDIQLSGSCDIGEPSEAARAKAGKQPDGSTVLINGKRIKPLGTEFPTGTFPTAAALSADGKYLAVLNNGLEDSTLVSRLPASNPATEANLNWQSVDFFDTSTEQYLYTLPVRGSFIGLEWHPSAQTLYVAGGGRDVVRRIAWTPGAATKATELAPWPILGYPTGLALDTAANLIYITLLHRHAVVALDLTTGIEVRRYTVQASPYDIELNPARTQALVSNWGTDTVSVLDLTTHKTLKTLTVGKNPEAIVWQPDGSKAYGAVSDTDAVAVIDGTSHAVTYYTIKAAETDPAGASPVDVRLSADGKRLYVASAQNNAVIVLDATTGARLGAVPGAQYTTSVELAPSGNKLYVVSAKGHGAGPNPDDSFVGNIIRGTLHMVATPNDAQLKSYDQNVHDYNNIMANIYSPSCQDVKHPIPVQFGEGSQVIKHVVYIMRENKTYDSLLGDLGPEYDGDPTLTVFGEEITPNLHALARRFGNLTNFYNESEQSVQGHIWGSTGWVNDYSEKMWIAMWGRPGESAIIVPGMEPASVPGTGDIFQHLARNKVSVRNLGEYTGVVFDIIGLTTNISNTKFPGYFGVDDAKKVDEFVEEVNNGRLDQFTFLLLGNDHTFGLDPGRPTPEYMVADNDLATGKAIEALSKSPFWDETVVIIFEDDPQGNADHIDAHRSICIVVSPWVKQGAVSRVAHSFPSIHKTMQLILGVPPISSVHTQSSAFYEVFGAEPANNAPYTAIPSNIPYAKNPSVEELEAAGKHRLAELARLSSTFDFSGPDRAPYLGSVLWEYRKGSKFPVGLAEIELEDDDD